MNRLLRDIAQHSIGPAKCDNRHLAEKHRDLAEYVVGAQRQKQHADGQEPQRKPDAGDMAGLDSSPTKLIEIVGIGKQLLMTRGSLTTFSIANDVAEYFAIIPALFLGAYKELAPFSARQP